MAGQDQRHVPAISVVVPFYDVAAYADACKLSLLDQDFEDYEVVCVDDGSTDGTGALLDVWARRDDRLCVFHTAHMGLSEARNLGVLMARAPLVSFVDGDDVVSPRYLGLLYEAHRDHGGRMVVGGSRPMHGDAAEPLVWPDVSRDARVLGRDDAISAYLRWEAGIVAWGRLAPRELYLRIPFELGILYEDSYAIPSHLSAVDEVVLLDTVVYGHTVRGGSISNPHSMTLEHAEGKLATIAHLCDVALGWPPGLRRLAVWRLDRHLLSLMNIAAMLPDRAVARRYRRFARKALARDLPWCSASAGRSGSRGSCPWRAPAPSLHPVCSTRSCARIGMARPRSAESLTTRPPCIVPRACRQSRPSSSHLYLDRPSSQAPAPRVNECPAAHGFLRTNR